MSQLNKPIILAALAFCALAFAQGPLPPTGGAAGPGAPGGAALSGALINQTVNLAPTTFLTCPAGTTNFCTYLIGLQLQCNAANPGTGSGTLGGNLVFTDNSVTNTTVTAQLNVASCVTGNAAVNGAYLPHFVIAKPGSVLQYQVTLGGTTGAYNYDLAWFAQRLS